MMAAAVVADIVMVGVVVSSAVMFDAVMAVAAVFFLVREWKQQAVTGGNRDAVWVELGECTWDYSVGRVGMVRKLSGGV